MKTSAPPAPDYQAIAQQQGAANIDAARTTAKLNNPNLITPYGTQTVTYGGPSTFDESAYNKAMQDFSSGGYQDRRNFNEEAYYGAHPGLAADKGYGAGTGRAYEHYQNFGKAEDAGKDTSSYWEAPTREMFYDQDRVTVEQQLSPEQQKLLDQNNRISSGLGDVAESAIGRVGGMLGTAYNPSNLPPMYRGFGEIARTDPRTGEVMKSFGETAGNVQYGVDPRFDQTGDQVQQALYRKQTSMLDPQFQQQSSDLEARLANQGIMPGSEAYNREMSNFARNRQNAYEGARDAAILAGGAEQSRLNEMGLSRAQLNNMAQAQDFGNLMGRAGFNNQAVAQMFGQELQANDQTFNQALQAAQFGNQARQQQLQEDLSLRQLPLNEITALMSGSQVNLPQFQQYTGGGSVSATPYFQAAQAQDQSNIARANAQNAGRSALTSGLFSLGGAALMAPTGTFSDERLKEDIKRIGHTDGGTPIYSYRYKWGGPVQFGVMAQEVEKTNPSAVSTHPSGFKMVDYSKVN